jgi:Helicase associated domain
VECVFVYVSLNCAAALCFVLTGDSFFAAIGGGKINPERIRKLEDINFEWNPQESQWKIMFERLQAFQEEMGHCKVPKGYQKDVELANWVRRFSFGLPLL